jgi:outer membrane protein OmpA-like peptidoglycan-associated protein
MFELSSRRAGKARLLAQLFGVAVCGVSFTAGAVDLGVKVEPGLALPVTQQQSQRFGPGFDVAGKLLLGLGPWFDLTAGATVLVLPSSSGSLSSGAGVAWGYGPGLRFKGRRDSDSWNGMSPWVDADALYVRTGDLSRFGFAAGAGLAFPIGDTRAYWVGPFARYQQVVGSGGSGIDGRDAKTVIVGLSLEFGTGRKAPPPAAVAVVSQPPVAAECPAIARLPDRDGDGVPDKFDKCPDVAGPIENQGCPAYEKVIVKEDKLELKEKIAFAKDTDKLEAESAPLLDEVAKALRDNKSFKVAIEGHASSEGTDEHNQSLSERRARAVLEYLAAHGVPRDRLSSRGFSSSRPIGSNETSAGRESNRRVEFVVQFVILNKDGSVQ